MQLVRERVSGLAASFVALWLKLASNHMQLSGESSPDHLECSQHLPSPDQAT